MITIKEYAEKKGVSHQAVYKQLQTHADELNPHIVIQGRTRYLTDEAVAILERYRDSSPQVVERTNDKERIDDLENKIKIMLERENRLMQEIVDLNRELKESYKTASENAFLIADSEKKALLLEQAECNYQSAENEIKILRSSIAEKELRINELELSIAEQSQKSRWKRFVELWK